MSKFIVSIDQGTTSTRCMVFDRESVVVSRAQKEHTQVYPQPGWVEHEPLEIWHRTIEVVREALDRGKVKSADIVAIGMTNQRETTVAWDRRTGKPFGNAIVWQDTRTRGICEELARGDGAGVDRFRALTGLPLATYFAAPKVRWMLDHVSGFADAARSGHAAVGTMDAWLMWNLTGRHVTDVTNASRTMLMDLRTLDWSDELLRAFDIPRSILPAILSSGDATGFGRTRVDGPFGAEIPVTGVLGDQQAALVGQTCFEPGESKNTYGTGCFMLLNTGGAPVQSRHGLLTTVAYRFEGQPTCYALEGSIAVTGSLVQWLRDNLGIIKDASEIEPLAGSVADSGGVYFVPAFSGLFAPHWRADARGCVVGMTRYTNRAHLARAALEATAFQTRDVLEAMRLDSGVALKSLRVDGGMCANNLLMQFQADVLDLPVVRPVVTETTALGAAYAAGLVVGFWKDVAELKQNWRADRTFSPGMSVETRDALTAGWNKAIQRSLDWAT